MNLFNDMKEVENVAELSIENNWCEFLLIFNK